MDLSGLGTTKQCIYCEVYNKIHVDYPVNAAEVFTNTEVPRCTFHGQYICSHCESGKHFNGVAWCGSCKQFTCLNCGETSVVDANFLVYDYYYSIRCMGCNETNPTLDFAETQGIHPYQIGDLRPSGNIMVWLPLTTVLYEPSKKLWGKALLESMTINVRYEVVEEIEGESKQIWDENAERWASLIPSDVNHKYLIIPQMLKYLDSTKKNILDIACGEGNFTRQLAMEGYTVTGLDISRLVDFAIQREEREPLGITYLKLSAQEITTNFEDNSFDQVTCNMALMDMDSLDLVLDNIAQVIRPGGRFVFSITHPILAWPVTRTIKLPRDSEHNEDKGWIVDNYNRELPMKLHWPIMPGPMLFYPRKISTYVTKLAEKGFVLTGLAEPEPAEELTRKYPRDMLHDYDRTTQFMVFQTRYEG